MDAFGMFRAASAVAAQTLSAKDYAEFVARFAFLLATPSASGSTGRSDAELAFYGMVSGFGVEGAFVQAWRARNPGKAIPWDQNQRMMLADIREYAEMTSGGSDDPQDRVQGYYAHNVLGCFFVSCNRGGLSEGQSQTMVFGDTSNFWVQFAMSEGFSGDRGIAEELVFHSADFAAGYEFSYNVSVGGRGASGPVEDLIRAVFAQKYDPEMAPAVLGSYRVDFRVNSVDRSAGTADVAIQVSNAMTWSSLSRNPVTGYTTPYNAYEESRVNRNMTATGHLVTIDMVILVEATLPVRFDP